MRHNILNISALFLLLFGMISCMEYDMDLPRTLAEFTDFQVENADKVTIDRDSRTIVIELNEMAYLSDVKIAGFALNPKARFAAGSFPESLDLSQPHKVVLSMYYDFEWTISATQKVSRYVKCAGQIGNAFFDVERKEAYVYVSESQRLRDLTINDLKFELAGSKVISTTGYVQENGQSVLKTQACAFPMVLDCTVKRTFTVETRGNIVEWTLSAIPKQVPAQITSVLPWCWSADIDATFDGGATVPTMQYKTKSATEWSEVSSDKVTVDGVNVKASIEGLEQATEYQVRLLLGGSEVSVQTFVTETPVQLYNLKFDEWKDDKTPYAVGKEGIWDTANPGTSMLSISPTTQETEDVVAGSAVRMQSMFKAKFAAGNIYVGQFDKVDIASLGATLHWGYGFTSMPVGLKGYYKYSPKPIDKATGPYESLLGKSDKCQVQIFLTDWDDRFLINTGANHFVDFDNDPHIIAFGKMESDEAMDEYKEFNIQLEYRSYRKPKFIVISCCASYLGDFFTGGVGSTLLVDEFELVYK